MKLFFSNNKALSTALIIGLALTGGAAAAHAEGGGAKKDMRTHGAEKSKERRVTGPGRLFAKIDANRDGVLTPNETEGLAPEKLSALDQDGDGTITKLEVIAAHKKAMKERQAVQRSSVRMKKAMKLSERRGAEGGQERAQAQRKDAEWNRPGAEAKSPRGEKGRTLALEMRSRDRVEARTDSVQKGPADARPDAPGKAQSDIRSDAPRKGHAKAKNK